MSAYAELIDSMATIAANCKYLRRELEAPHYCVRPVDASPAFFNAVRETEQLASRLNDQLCNARLDEQIARVEAIRDEPKPDRRPLAKLMDEVNAAIEDLNPYSVCASVERQVWHRVLGMIERSL